MNGLVIWVQVLFELTASGVECHARCGAEEGGEGASWRAMRGKIPAVSPSGVQEMTPRNLFQVCINDLKCISGEHAASTMIAIRLKNRTCQES